MDKVEYKLRSDEIKKLIQQKDFAQAAEIADTIDWRRVQSVMMLCTISDVYKMNRRYENAKDLLLLAYEHRPGGRSIVYSLCELCLRTGDIIHAMEYYKEFVKVAPRDPGRYVLQYKIYEDQDVSLEERIEVLEELKKHDYREKWAYELAYLYHRVGLGTRCVEECDEMIACFGDGDYVIKAMELKMLHQPLNEEQQKVYDHRYDPKPEEEDFLDEEDQDDTEATLDAGDTEDAEDAIEGDTTVWRKEDVQQPQVTGDTIVYEPVHIGTDESYPEEADGDFSADDGFESYGDAETVDENLEGSDEDEEPDIYVKTMDVGQYNTINLQAALAQELKQYLDDDAQEAQENPLDGAEPEGFENSNEIEDDGEASGEPIEEEYYPEPQAVAEEFSAEADPYAIEDDDPDEMPKAVENSEVFFGETGEINVNRTTVYPDSAESNMVGIEPPKEMAGVLSQESDGQLRIVLPQANTVEKQITGQMDIQDVLAEWERMKKENEEKHKEEVRLHVLQQTGSMFTEFEAAVRDGLLEKLEKGDDTVVLPEQSTEDADEFGEVEELEEIETTEFSEPEEAEIEEAEIEETEIEETEIEEAEIEEAKIEEAKIEETEIEETEIEETEIEETEIEETEIQEVEPEEPEMEPAEAEITEEPELEEESAETEISEETEAESAETEIDEKTTAEPEENPAESETFEETESDAEEKPVESDAVEEPEEKPAEPAETESEETETVEETAAKPETAEHTGGAEPEKQRSTKEKVRPMTREEREHFSAYIQSKATREQIVKAIDNISLAAYTGNVIITGEVDVDTIPLAKRVIREIQVNDTNFSGQVAKISGHGLSQKDMDETIGQLQNGALIIQSASGMEEHTVHELFKALQRENFGIVVLMQDDTKSMDAFLEKYAFLKEVFTSRVDVKALSNDMLVAYGKQYAKEQEFSIDELGVLALHNRIEKKQTIDHAVTMAEVKTIVDQAIRHAKRPSIGHFVGILAGKRYDEEDMIIVTEKDFAS